MLTQFEMNGYLWRVRFTYPSDPVLIDRTGTMTVAVTDPGTMTIYLSDELSGDFLLRVLIHELSHCAMFSFNLLPEIHKMVKKKHWIEAEEWCCNLLSDYGRMIYETAYSVIGGRAVFVVPGELERLVA